MKMVCILHHHNESFRSYIFCPLEFIKVIEDMDQNNLDAATILKNWILLVKDRVDSRDNRLVIIETFKRVINWLVNVIHSRINTFSFHYKVLNDTNKWYQGVCASIFGIETESKRKYTSTISDSNSKDEIQVVKKRWVQEQVINI